MSSNFEVPGTVGRPSVVSAAAYLQFAIGALGVIASVIGVFRTIATMSRMREVVSDVEVSGVDSEGVNAFLDLTEAATYAGIVVSLLFAGAVALLGVFNMKGKNGTRIATWVLAGLGLACGVCGSLIGTLGMVSGGVSSGDELTDAMNQSMESLPAWYEWSNIAFTVLDVVLYLAIIILLAVPAANEFFRKPKPEMDITLPPQAYVDAPPPPAAPSEQPAEGESSSAESAKDEPSDADGKGETSDAESAKDEPSDADTKDEPSDADGKDAPEDDESGQSKR